MKTALLSGLWVLAVCATVQADVYVPVADPQAILNDWPASSLSTGRNTSSRSSGEPMLDTRVRPW